MSDPRIWRVRGGDFFLNTQDIPNICGVMVNYTSHVIENATLDRNTQAIFAHPPDAKFKKW